MNILVYEDERLKSGEVRDVIEDMDQKHEIDVETSLKDVKERIKKHKYHMVIVDLETPIGRSDEMKEKKAGIEFLQYIFQSEDDFFYKPDEVVVLTQYASDMELIQMIKKYPVSILKYQIRDEEWKNDLINRIYDCNKKYENIVDIAIITAVEKEFDAFYSRKNGWKQLEIENDPNLYFTMEYSNKTGRDLKVLLARLPMMGMVSAADVTHRIINQFHPCCIIMSGFCGGNKKEAKPGDIIVAEKAWDYGSGSMEKVTDEEGNNIIGFVPAPVQISADKMIIKEFKKYALDEELKNTIRKQCDKSIFDRTIDIRIGGMATGAAVIKNEDFTNRFIVPANRKYIGIDMETYGMYYAADHFADESIKFVSIKSVSDGADENKSDEFQEYCARLAANLTNYFIENITYGIIGVK